MQSATFRQAPIEKCLGAVETMITHPAAMTHAPHKPEIRRLTEGLARLSVGIEAAKDILVDPAPALDQV
jgi:cystathionine beta-lyase/cystathionine gamma-synthase